MERGKSLQQLKKKAGQERKLAILIGLVAWRDGGEGMERE